MEVENQIKPENPATIVTTALESPLTQLNIDNTYLTPTCTCSRLLTALPCNCAHKCCNIEESFIMAMLKCSIINITNYIIFIILLD